MLVDRIFFRGLECSEIHPKADTGANQSRAADMHFPDGVRHLRDGCDFFNDETVRQKPLINQLNDAVIRFLQPDRPKMFAAYIHLL